MVGSAEAVSLRACHRATGDERYRCNSKLGTDHGILSCHRVRQRRTEAGPRLFRGNWDGHARHSGLSSSPLRNSGYNNDQPTVATSSRRRRKLGYGFPNVLDFWKCVAPDRSLAPLFTLLFALLGGAHRFPSDTVGVVDVFLRALSTLLMDQVEVTDSRLFMGIQFEQCSRCLLYTSDAADE